MNESIIELIKADFKDELARNKRIPTFLRKVQNKKANFIDCQKYSKELGDILGKIFVQRFGDFSAIPEADREKIVLDAISETLHINHDLVNKGAVDVQKIMDEEDGIHLGAIEPEFDSERVSGIVTNVLEEGLEAEKIADRLERHTTNFTESVFDKFIKENAEFRYDSGLGPQVIRICVGRKPCNWCMNLAGTYDYEKVKQTGNPVWQRHSKCHCQVIYRNGTRMENAHTKRSY